MVNQQSSQQSSVEKPSAAPATARDVSPPAPPIIPAAVVGRSSGAQADPRDARWWRAAVDASPDPIFLVDQASLRFVDANRSACDRLGHSVDSLLASGLPQVFPYLAAHDLGRVHAQASLTPIIVPTVMCHRDGTQVRVELSVRSVDQRSPHLVCFARVAGDSATTMSRQVSHDALTGLPDRRVFAERLRECLELARNANDYRLAVLFIDIDKFKGVNDALGHAAGDQLLCEFGQRLSACVRSIDLVARYGGDEFTVLVGDMSRDEDATGIAQRVHQELELPYEIRGRRLKVRASLGIALASPERGSADQLLDEADAAMYRVKAAGGDGYAVAGQGPEIIWDRSSD